MPVAAQQAVELAIGGMTCASCAARVEKKLNKVDGVTATVNFATEKARVVFPAAVSPADLIAVVERTGYTAALPPPPAWFLLSGKPAKPRIRSAGKISSSERVRAPPASLSP